MADLDYEGVWKETLIQLRNDLGGAEFSGWFSDMKYLRSRTDEKTGQDALIIGIPSAFHRDKITSRYKSAIHSKLKDISGKEINVEFEIIGKTAKKEPQQPQLFEENGDFDLEMPAEPRKSGKKKGKHPQMRDDFTFDRYVICESNKFAANAAISISRNPGKNYNPFLIYGGVGLGKTHLMQAIGNFIHENSDLKVIYITSEDFLNEYVLSLRDDNPNIFKNKYRYNADVLLIDDIQFFTDKPGVQGELFHTFNALINAKKQMVFTCDRPITELKKFSDRLISRFGQGLPMDIQLPLYEERCAILKKTAENRNAQIPDEVIDLVSKNIASNVRDLISALNTLIGYTELMGKPVTIEIAQQHLKTIFNTPRQANLSMDNIIRVVAEYFSLTPNDLKGKKKTQNIVFARQIAMYIGREMTDYSTTELGQDFGGRDHTTVMHSIDKIKKNFLTDPTLESTIDSLKRSVKEMSAKY